MTSGSGVLVDWPATWLPARLRYGVTTEETLSSVSAELSGVARSLAGWLTFTRAVHRLAPLCLATWVPQQGDPFGTTEPAGEEWHGWWGAATVSVPGADVPLEHLRSPSPSLVPGLGISDLDDGHWPTVRHVVADDVVVTIDGRTTSRPVVAVEHCVARDGVTVDLVVRVVMGSEVGTRLEDVAAPAAELLVLADACASTLRPAGEVP